MRPLDDAPNTDELLPELLADNLARTGRAEVTDALDAIDGALNRNIRPVKGSTMKPIRRPYFLDWRFYVCLAVQVLVGLTVVHGFGVEESNWRFAIYFVGGWFASMQCDEWNDWRESKGRVR
jgi:hypothetical protein